MDGPWYQASGPDAYYVRSALEDSFSKTDNFIFHNVLEKCIDRIVPTNRNDFGSWRGYHSNNMLKELKNIIENLYNKKINNSMKILNERFAPHVVHYLYKPGGLYMKRAEERFNTNKKRELNTKI
tara:strand:- start:534 stop:908 length:375 start_codon:yes stop_codon:yes gene_type:complete